MDGNGTSGDFVGDLSTAYLEKLRERRRVLDAFLIEAERLDVAIAEAERMQERLTGKLEKLAPPSQRTLPAPGETGTLKQKVLDVLGRHPHGLNAMSIAREAGIPTGSMGATLAKLVETGEVDRPGRGFYRLPQRAVAITE